MITLEQWLLFASAALVVIVAPGPDNLGTLGVGLARGRRAAMAFAAGCSLGCLTHTLWAAIGVSAALAASTAAFTALKLAGAAYLTWLGVDALRRRGGVEVDSRAASANSAGGNDRYLWRGFLANAINPKVALFFLAFLPQFVRAEASAALQLALLGISFALLSAALFLTLAYFSAEAGRWLRRRPSAGRWLDRIAGCVFIGLAAHLVFASGDATR